MRSRTRIRALAAGACLLAGAAAVPVAVAVARPVTKKVQVGDNYFSPTKVTISKGSSIKWVWSNQNINTHNVTLIKGPKGVRHKAFTSIDGARGLTYKRTFTKPGTYTFECTIHPSMVTKVVVRR